MPRAVLFALAVLFATAFSVPSLAADDARSLLAGLTPIGAHHVRRAKALNDGVAAPEGDLWKTSATMQLVGHDAFVIYDLGRSCAIAAAWLQADNNDTYVVEVSQDGRTFEPLWEATATREVGLRSRHASNLTASGRYVRLRATGGDESFAVSELLLFEHAPQPFPPVVPRVRGVSLDDLTRDRVLVFVLAAIVATLLARRGARRFWTVGLAALPIVAAVPLAATLWEAWPVSPQCVALVRGAMAALCLAAVVRELVPSRRFPADRRFTVSAMAFAGVTAVLCFYNLGSPQFRDAARGEPAFAHYPDLRQYHPTARFFRELGYRGLYEADILAFSETAKVSLDALGSRPMRDLSDAKQDVTTVGRKRAAILARRARFTDARWEEYKRDVVFFRSVMGDEQYLETMIDYGAYATPVWVATGRLLWLGPPSRAAFTATGFLDLALITAAFVAIWRAFGARTAFVAMVVFGANDLVVYGTNWAGATLRHDWLAYLALAACALKVGRPGLGGVLLAAATMIRAFPLLALGAVAFPVVWSIVDHRLTKGRWPRISDVREQNADAEQVFFAAAITVCALLVFSSVVLTPDAWPAWYAKVTEGQSIPHMADVSFRAFVGGTGPDRAAILARRLPVVIAGAGVIASMAFVAARGASVGRAMLLGLPLVPTLLNPTSYYGHLLFLLVMLVDARPGEGSPVPWRDGAIWVFMLAMCVVQYFTQVPDLPQHFAMDTAVVMVTLGCVLLVLTRERAIAAGWIDGPGAPVR